MRWMSDEKFFEQFIPVNAPSFEGAFIVPPVNSVFAICVLPDVVLVDMSLLEVKAVSLKLRDSRGDEFAQEGVTMQFNGKGDGLNWRKPDDVDIVFILQKSEMPFSSFVFKPRIEPDIGDAFLIIKRMNDVKHDVRIRAA